MTHRLTSRSNGRGRALSAVIAEWAAGNPGIRRVWVFVSRAEDAPRPDGDIDVMVELQPVTDSEETLALWMANCGKWRLQLQGRIGGPVGLDWFDPDGATRTVRPGREEARVLVYERAG